MAGLTQVVFEKRSRLATTKERASNFKGTAEKFERYALGLLAAAAIMMGVKDIVMATKTSSTRRQVAYIGAFSAQMGVAGNTEELN